MSATAGVLLVLLGQATAILGMSAWTAGHARRGVGAVAVGLCLAAAGLWLLGALA